MNLYLGHFLLEFLELFILAFLFYAALVPFHIWFLCKESLALFARKWLDSLMNNGNMSNQISFDCKAGFTFWTQMGQFFFMYRLYMFFLLNIKCWLFNNFRIKGQLISECLFDFPKQTNEKFDKFLPQNLKSGQIIT